MAKLSPKQALFVKEYLVDLNGKQAAIRAGYSEKTAQVIAAQNLTKLIITEAIQEEMNKRANRIEITADRVLQEIAKLAFHDPRKFFDDDGRLKPISELDDDTAACISGLETMHKIVRKEKDGCIVLTKIKIADKGQNLERLGKHLKLFTDKVESEVTNNVTITVLSPEDAKL